MTSRAARLAALPLGERLKDIGRPVQVSWIRYRAPNDPRARTRYHGIAVHGLRTGRYNVRLYLRWTNRGSLGGYPGWHSHDGHRGWSFVFAGGYVEESAESLRRTPPTTRTGALYRPVGTRTRIQVRAPCVRWIRRDHRVKGRWGGLLVHVEPRPV